MSTKVHANDPANPTHGILQWIAGMETPSSPTSYSRNLETSDSESHEDSEVDWDIVRSRPASLWSVSSLSSTGSLSTRPASIYSRAPGMPCMPRRPMVRYSMSEIIAARLARSGDHGSSDAVSATSRSSISVSEYRIEIEHSHTDEKDVSSPVSPSPSSASSISLPHRHGSTYIHAPNPTVPHPTLPSILKKRPRLDFADAPRPVRAVRFSSPVDESSEEDLANVESVVSTESSLSEVEHASLVVPLEDSPVTGRDIVNPPLGPHRPHSQSSHRCSLCSALLSFPIPQTDMFEIQSILHLTCPTCLTTHCRGCGKPTPCLPTCLAHPPCPIPTCCPEVRAISIYEALSKFDQHYGHGGSTLVRRREVLLHTLEEVAALLRPTDLPISSFSPHSSHTQPHPSVQSVILLSHLTADIHAMLSSRSIPTWNVNSTVYLAVLAFLRILVECGFRDLIVNPLPKPDIGGGLRRQHWHYYDRIPSDMIPSILAPTPHSLTPDTEVGTDPIGCFPPLYNHIQDLHERFVPRLKAFGRSTTSRPIEERMVALCDGIEYLAVSGRGEGRRYEELG